jgi:hypothetical protein
MKSPGGGSRHIRLSPSFFSSRRGLAATWDVAELDCAVRAGMTQTTNSSNDIAANVRLTKFEFTGTPLSKSDPHPSNSPCKDRWARAGRRLFQSCRECRVERKARTAYRDFLKLWKNADPDIPVLKQAYAPAFSRSGCNLNFGRMPSPTVISRTRLWLWCAPVSGSGSPASTFQFCCPLTKPLRGQGTSHKILAWSATVLYSFNEKFQYLKPTKANILSTLL